MEQLNKCVVIKWPEYNNLSVLEAVQIQDKEDRSKGIKELTIRYTLHGFVRLQKT